MRIIKKKKKQPRLCLQEPPQCRSPCTPCTAPQLPTAAAVPRHLAPPTYSTSTASRNLQYQAAHKRTANQATANKKPAESHPKFCSHGTQTVASKFSAATSTSRRLPIVYIRKPALTQSEKLKPLLAYKTFFSAAPGVSPHHVFSRRP